MECNSVEVLRAAEKIFASAPPLGETVSNTWNVKLVREFDSSNDSARFNTDGDGYPLYEGKVIMAFDHLYAAPRFWMKESVARNAELSKLWAELLKRGRKPKHLDNEQFRVGFRRIAASTNERAFISALIPRFSACPDTCMIVRRLSPHPKSGEPVELIGAAQSIFLAAVFNSFVCDNTMRMKITTHLDMHFVYSLPIPRLGNGDAKDATYFWPVVARALRLISTTDEYATLWDEVFPHVPAATLNALRTTPAAYGPGHEQALRERLATSAAALTANWTSACGLHDRKPDRRDDGDRAQTRAELDALIAHLYGLTKAEFAYILDTFPVLRRKELTAFGEYRSRRKALEEYIRFAP
jgi:hypothetical protein